MQVLLSREMLFMPESLPLLKKMTLSGKSSDAVILPQQEEFQLIKFIKNPTTQGANISTNYDNFIYTDSTYSQSVYDITSLTYTDGTLIYQIYLDKVSTNTFDLSHLGIDIFRDETLIITGLSTGGSDLICSLSFVEDI